jgi:hypothetical protein
LRRITFLLAAIAALSACGASRSQADRDRAAGRLPRTEAAALVSAELHRRVVYTVLAEGPICYEPLNDLHPWFTVSRAQRYELVTGLDKDGRGRLYLELPTQERDAFGCRRKPTAYTEVATIALTDKGRAEASRWWVAGKASDWRADGRPSALWRIPIVGQRLKAVGAVLPRGSDAADIVFTWEWVQLDGSEIALSEWAFAFVPIGLDAAGIDEQVLRRPPEVEDPFGLRHGEDSQVARAERTAAGWRITRMNVPDPGFGLFLEVLPAPGTP